MLNFSRITIRKMWKKLHQLKTPILVEDTMKMFLNGVELRTPQLAAFCEIFARYLHLGVFLHLQTFQHFCSYFFRVGNASDTAIEYFFNEYENKALKTCKRLPSLFII